MCYIRCVCYIPIQIPHPPRSITSERFCHKRVIRPYVCMWSVCKHLERLLTWDRQEKVNGVCNNTLWYRHHLFTERLYLIFVHDHRVGFRGSSLLSRTRRRRHQKHRRLGTCRRRSKIVWHHLRFRLMERCLDFDGSDGDTAINIRRHTLSPDRKFLNTPAVGGKIRSSCWIKCPALHRRLMTLLLIITWCCSPGIFSIRCAR